MIRIEITGENLHECLSQIMNIPMLGVPIIPTEHIQVPTEEPMPVLTADEPTPEQAAETAKATAATAKKAVQKAVEKVEPQPEPQPESQPEPEPQPEPAPAEDAPKPTYDDVHNIALKVRDTLSIGALRLILSTYGANKVGQLTEDQYADFIAKCEDRLAKGGK